MSNPDGTFEWSTPESKINNTEPKIKCEIVKRADNITFENCKDASRVLITGRFSLNKDNEYELDCQGTIDGVPVINHPGAGHQNTKEKTQHYGETEVQTDLTGDDIISHDDFVYKLLNQDLQPAELNLKILFKDLNNEEIGRKKIPCVISTGKINSTDDKSDTLSIRNENLLQKNTSRTLKPKLSRSGNVSKRSSKQSSHSSVLSRKSSLENLKNKRGAGGSKNITKAQPKKRAETQNKNASSSINTQNKMNRPVNNKVVDKTKRKESHHDFETQTDIQTVEVLYRTEDIQSKPQKVMKLVDDPKVLNIKPKYSPNPFQHRRSSVYLGTIVDFRNKRPLLGSVSKDNVKKASTLNNNAQKQGMDSGSLTQSKTSKTPQSSRSPSPARRSPGGSFKSSSRSPSPPKKLNLTSSPQRKPSPSDLSCKLASCPKCIICSSHYLQLDGHGNEQPILLPSKKSTGSSKPPSLIRSPEKTLSPVGSICKNASYKNGTTSTYNAINKPQGNEKKPGKNKSTCSYKLLNSDCPKVLNIARFPPKSSPVKVSCKSQQFSKSVNNFQHENGNKMKSTKPLNLLSPLSKNSYSGSPKSSSFAKSPPKKNPPVNIPCTLKKYNNRIINSQLDPDVGKNNSKNGPTLPINLAKILISKYSSSDEADSHSENMETENPLCRKCNISTELIHQVKCTSKEPSTKESLKSKPRSNSPSSTKKSSLRERPLSPTRYWNSESPNTSTSPKRPIDTKPNSPNSEPCPICECLGNICLYHNASKLVDVNIDKIDVSKNVIEFAYAATDEEDITELSKITPKNCSTPAHNSENLERELKKKMLIESFIKQMDSESDVSINLVNHNNFNDRTGNPNETKVTVNIDGDGEFYDLKFRKNSKNIANLIVKKTMKQNTFIGHSKKTNSHSQEHYSRKATTSNYDQKIKLDSNHESIFNADLEVGKMLRGSGNNVLDIEYDTISKTPSKKGRGVSVCFTKTGTSVFTDKYKVRSFSHPYNLYNARHQLNHDYDEDLDFDHNDEHRESLFLDKSSSHENPSSLLRSATLEDSLLVNDNTIVVPEEKSSVDDGIKLLATEDLSYPDADNPDECPTAKDFNVGP